ncbi:BTAD domain-containing putative transcriptional regulator [Actinoplanes sp. NPDC049316]|uniref:AfsR/SARP family transcriptional regulator n=1 Tax=Actinoplanes sp. NPDC049316 TaxID=3154727 RepID=UPI00343D8C66
MQFGILGTFEIVLGGRTITPSAPKLRRVLALLVMQANSVVPTRLLIDELWEDRPPVSSATTLQTYIYQLRKLLGIGEPDASGRPESDRHSVALHTRPGGYLLYLPPDALDACRFEELAAAGREQLARNQIFEAAETFRRALELWRGPVLSDLEYGPVLHAEVIRLHELRNSVAEMRIDADLSLGRHQQLISELTAVTARDHAHEGLNARLMLALYRAGRRSEALRIFKRVRAALADELGLEPGPELQRLHRGILAGDPVLDVHGPMVTPDTALSPPAQLPPAVPLTGREEEAERVRRHLLDRSQAAPTTVIVGPPGAGVTALCLHVANQIRQEFPDGQFFARLSDDEGNPVPPAEILGTFLRAVGHPGTDSTTGLADRSALFRSWCADRRVLVVLDNVSDAAVLACLTPSGAGSATLVGSRRRVCPNGLTSTVELAPFSPAQSLEFLASAIGTERVRTETAAAQRLVGLCGGIAAALRAAANELVTRPHWRIADLLARIGDDEAQSRWLAATGLLERSVANRLRMLPAGDQQLLRLLSRLGRPAVTASGAASLLDVPVRAAETALEQCAAVRLVDVDSRGADEADWEFQYRLHPLIQTIVTTLSAVQV